MVSKKNFKTGDLVKILRKEWAGSVGIVTQPIAKETTGHVLVHKEGVILGMDASSKDVELASESGEGFAQLGYQLIKLGSHVIEQKLILYRT